MKRYIYIFTCILLCYLLCTPCFAFFGKENPPAAQEDPRNLPKDASHLKKKYKDDLSGLMERRYIRVLTAFNKTNFFIFKGGLFGFEYALLKDYEKFLNKGIKKSDLRVREGAQIAWMVCKNNADKSIGISDVHNVENNIHAGIKYLVHLRDHYFQDPDLSKRNRIRFILAAYNAAPSRIKGLRKSTLQMGLNPNRWFRNVEMAALKHIGQETVQYVSNINKYYIIYSIGLDEM